MTDAVANSFLAETLVTDPGTVVINAIGLETIVTDAGTIFINTVVQECLVSDLTNNAHQTSVTVIS